MIIYKDSPFAYNKTVVQNNNYSDILLEYINGKFDRIIEIVGQLSDQVDLKSNQSDVEAIADNVIVIKAAVSDTNIQLRDQERRITSLENA